MKHVFVLFFSLLVALQPMLIAQAKISAAAAPTNTSAQDVAILPHRDGIQKNIESYIKEHENTAASVAVAVFENQEAIVSLHHGMAGVLCLDGF